MGRAMHYRVYVPASYAQGEKRYPVLYLLHGLYGNQKDWSDRTEIKSYLDGADLIVVMPDANDSWYVNWDTDPKQRYEDYIIKDLVAEIESNYRIDVKRESRFIAGLSMGGYGALKFGLKYPQMFSFAGSFSGALNAPTRLEDQEQNFANQLDKAFGAKDSKTRADNDILRLIKVADVNAIPYLYLDCGSDDFLLQANRDFVAVLPGLHVRYQYQERPGKHEWPFWDRSIRQFLPLLQAH